MSGEFLDPIVELGETRLSLNFGVVTRSIVIGPELVTGLLDLLLIFGAGAIEDFRVSLFGRQIGELLDELCVLDLAALLILLRQKFIETAFGLGGTALRLGSRGRSALKPGFLRFATATVSTLSYISIMLRRFLREALPLVEDFEVIGIAGAAFAIRALPICVGGIAGIFDRV